MDTVVSHWAMVHQQLSPAEWKKIPGAKAAVDKEYQQLMDIKFCDMESVQEHSKLCDRAKKTGKVLHFGRIFHYVILNIANWKLFSYIQRQSCIWWQ